MTAWITANRRQNLASGKADECGQANSNCARDRQNGLPQCRGHNERRELMRGAIAHPHRRHDEEDRRCISQRVGLTAIPNRLSDTEHDPARHKSDCERQDWPAAGMKGREPCPQSDCDRQGIDSSIVDQRAKGTYAEDRENESKCLCCRSLYKNVTRTQIQFRVQHLSFMRVVAILLTLPNKLCLALL